MREEICRMILSTIKQTIKEKNITQEQFANVAGIPDKSFGNIVHRLKRNRVPSTDIIERIEKGIGKLA